MGIEAGAAVESEHAGKWTTLLRRLDRRTLAIIAFLFGAAVMLSYRPWSQIEVGDPALYDYLAQSIVRGQMPYRDIVDIKGPGGAYISALAILAGEAIGLRDVIAIRLMNVALVGLLSALTFMVSEIYLRNRLAAILAFLIPLMPEHFPMMMITGTQPKLPMILFGTATLLLIARGKPFWAGLCSMLSCLCWQPGLLFTGTAFLIFSGYLTSWRDMRALKVLIGAAVPLLVVLGYFYSRGALADFWAWTMTYNYGVFGPDAQKGLVGALQKLWKVTLRVFQPDMSALGNRLISHLRRTFEPLAGLVTLAMVPASMIGLLLFGFDQVREKVKGKQPVQSPGLLRDSLLIPPIVYLGFCLINFQSGPDLIPFFPFIGIFAGWFLVSAGRGLARCVNRMPSRVVREEWVASLALALILSIILARTITYRVQGWTLQHQDGQFRVLSDLLEPNDKIYVHGTVEILVLLNQPNLTPFVDFDWGKDNFAAFRRGVSFDTIVGEMESHSPKIVALSRLGAVAHRAELEQWVSEHYDKLEVSGYDGVYLRRP